MKLLDKYEDISTSLVRNFSLYQIKDINFYTEPQKDQRIKDIILYIKGVTLYDPISGREVEIACKYDGPFLTTFNIFSVTISNSLDSSIITISTNIDALEESIERTNIIKIIGLLKTKRRQRSSR